MKTVEPTEEKMIAWLNESVNDKPIVMVNFLKYNDQAVYESNTVDLSSCSGKKAYDRYTKAVSPLLWEVGGQLLWMGKIRSVVIAPNHESWDAVMLVYYPNREAFKKMVTSDAYKQIMHHRTAALSDSRLIETRPIKLPGMILSSLRKLIQLKAFFYPKIR